MGKKSYKRRTYVLMALMLVLAVLFSACGNKETNTKQDKKQASESLTLWYGDSSMKEYVEQAAAAYKKKTGVKITCEYKESERYLEMIYDASINEEGAPDLYLLRSDRLGRASMMGITAVNSSKGYDKKHYCGTALNAASYQGTLQAYPLSYKVSCMVYNKACMETAPATAGAVTAYAETAQMPEGMQYILYWDINDYFCNFALVGNYLDVGREQDPAALAVLDEKCGYCLLKFWELSQYFALDGTAVSGGGVVASMAEGRSACILTDSDKLAVLEELNSQSDAPVSYGIGKVFDVADDLQSQSGSYTELAVVNGLSLKQEQAGQFAQFLTDTYAEHLYTLTGHFPAKAGIKFKNKELEAVYEAYKQSQSFSNLPQTQDLNLWLEILFSNVRQGEDIALQLQEFHNKIQQRVNKQTS